MAVAFVNNWDIILSKLESLFRTEFKGALKVYSGLQNEMESNQYLRLSPISSSLIDYSTTLETREFVIGMVLYFKEPNIKKTGVDNVMRLVSRIETIIANNNSITLPDGSLAYDCKIESSEIEASDSEYLVQFNLKCTHANLIASPIVAITASEVSDGDSSFDTSLSLTFKTSHTTTDFVVGDVSVSNGSLSSFAGSGTTYTATFTPAAAGATTIQVTADKFTDYSGNENAASSVFNWTYVVKFVSTWLLVDAERTVTLPLVNDGNTINFDIDWGDSTTSTITTYDQVLSGEDVAVTHTYGSAGTKTIAIGGTNSTISGFRFHGIGDKDKIRTISSWGTLNISTFRAFWRCTNLNVTATDTPTISTETLQQCFGSCTALTSIGGDWDVSNVTNMSSTFDACVNFNQDISAWDTSNVTIFAETFKSCSIFNQDIGSWDLSSAVSTFGMFKSATVFNQDIGAWDVSKVTAMKEMFKATGYFDQDLSDWDFDDVTGTTVGFNDFMQNSNAISTANYNALLVQIEDTNEETNLVFHGGDAIPTGVGDTARAALITRGWTITDGDS